MNKLLRNVMKIMMTIALMFTIATSFDVKLNAETITDGNVKLDIPEYDSNVGWVPGTVYSAKINVDFMDDTSTGKLVKIKIPMGLRYVSYPSANPATSGDLKEIEVEPSGDFAPLLTGTTSAIKTYAPGFYDEIVYSIKPNAKKIEFSIKLTVDEYLYYGPKTFSADNGIHVSAEKEENSIGLIQMGVKAINSGSIGFNVGGSTYIKEYTVLEGDSDLLTTTTPLGAYRIGFLYPTNFYVKAIESYYYYPVNEGLLIAGGNHKDGCSSVNNKENGYLKVTCNEMTLSSALLYGVKFNTSLLSVGKYQHLDGTKLKNQTVSFTTYDGKEIEATKSDNLVAPTINVADSSDVSEKLTLTIYKDYGYSKISSDYSTAITYQIKNDLLSVKKDQILEFESGNNVEVEELVLPNLVKSFKYKTNLNNASWIDLDISKLTKTNSPSNSLPTFNVKKMGLENGEYLSNAIIELYDVNKGMQFGDYTKTENLRVLAKLKDDINSDEVTFKTYKLKPDNSVDNATLELVKTKLVRKELGTTAKRAIPNTLIEAGTTKNVTAKISTNYFYYTNAVGMVNPAIYLKLPNGVTIDKDSVEITSSKISGDINFIVSDPYTIKNGDTYVEIDIKHFMGGHFDSKAVNDMSISFDIQTSLLSSGSYKWNNYAFLSDKSNLLRNDGNYSGEQVSIKDVNDIDRDDNVDELIMPFRANHFIIQEKKALLIDTFIRASASDPREADYDTSKPTSAINFTPGTEAVYTVDIYNNRTDAPGTLAQTTAYIPVPKKDLYFGSKFQEHPGYWNMKLGSVAPVVKVYNVNPETGVETDVTAAKASNYKLEYSKDASNATDYESALYSTTQSADTTMIRITNSVGVDVQEKAVIEFVYVVDETPDSVKEGGKLGEINDFRPHYSFESAGNSGSAEGTRVGANLVIGEISGLAFKDMNKDGVYTAKPDGVDEIMDNQVVKLYKHNGTSYEPYIYPGESAQAEVTTGSDGMYKFSNLPNGNYKIDFKTLSTAGETEFTPIKVGNDFKVDSDVEVSGTDAGMALGIDPTKEASKYIYAGIISYKPPVELIMTFDDDTDVDKSITVLGQLDGSGAGTSSTIKMKLEPDFFETIADKTYDNDGMKAESSDGTKASVEWTGNLVDKGGYLETSATITGVAKGSSVVTLSIKDVYGESRELKVNVTVKANSRPVISASDTTVEAGDTTFNLASLASITDAEDGASGLTTKVKSNDGFNVNSVGEYTIVYESDTADSDGNLALDKTITVSVVDTTKPVTTITPSPSGASVNPTAITVSGTDNASGTLTHSWSVVDSSNNVISSGSGADVTIPSADGTYTVKATSSDAASNVSDEVSFTFIINSSTPEVAIVITPTSKHNPTEIKVNATDGTDPSPTVSYTIKNSSNTVVDSQSNVASGATASIPTTDGVYTITAKAKNNASAESSEISDTFTIDKTAPLPVITITPVSKLNPTSVVVSATDAIDKNPKLSYEIKDSSNTVVKDGSNVASGSSATLPTADGVYTIEVVAVDASSNTSTKVSDTFT
ncbi:hypothetical protein OKW23_001398, partial [Bacilli bacterium PM5-9]|nr:hypothetical protein [Bacilli bacterium PM5-9]